MDGWNRWGDNDERGAANLVDESAVKRGLAAVTEHRAISLAAPIVPDRGFGVIGRPAPQHFMRRDGGDYANGLPERGGFGFADDWVGMPSHGVSHLDALSHVWQDGQMYNGHEASTVSSRGADRCGIEKVGPIVTRGVLLDLVPTGRSHLDPGEGIAADVLQEMLDELADPFAPGDALLVRTGWLDAQRHGLVDGTAWPGLHAGCAALLADLQPVLIGADNPGVEALPSSDPTCQVPLHVALLRGHGIYFAELLDLDELAAAGRSSFLLVLSPLPVVGGVGGPVTPVAVI